MNYNIKCETGVFDTHPTIWKLLKQFVAKLFKK